MKPFRFAAVIMMSLALPMKARACSACFSAAMEQGGFFHALSIVILITLATVFLILGILAATIMRVERSREAHS